jgi:Vault protein inter-alpha-trypsin domain/von Willebrand factor type A domain
MVFDRPGIYWDPREPIPPEIRRQLDLEREIAGLQHRRTRDFGLRLQNIRVPDRREYRRPVVQEAEVPQDRPEPAPQPVQPRGQADDYVDLPSDDGFLPPVSASVRAQLIQDTAKVSVNQLFVNGSSCVIPKASYTFPLPHSCTVVDFVCRVGSDKILKGKVKPKEEARNAFDSTVRRNETAGLLDQNTPEIFTTTLGNIPANARLKIEISFIVLLKYNFEADNGITTFTLPTYIAPRFGTPPRSLRQALRTSTNLRSLTVEVNVLAAEVMESITSSSHDISVEMGVGGRACQTWREFVQSGQREDPKSALVHLPETVTHLERDFVLKIRTRPDAGMEGPHACVETHPDLENHRAVMLTIPPDFMLRSQTRAGNGNNGEIIFVADRSGSMTDKIVALKSAMEFFLKGIPAIREERQFNIWCFGSDYEYLWPRSRAYSNRSMQDALAYVSHSFNANMGGTKLLPALKAVAATRGPYRATDIVTLTDGEVWDLDETLDFVERTRRDSDGRVRFFCLGIGAAVSHALVEGIAKLGGGYAEVIPVASQGGWESRVVAVLKAALTGHIGPISVEMEDQIEAEGLGGPVRLGECCYYLQERSSKTPCNIANRRTRSTRPRHRPQL